MKAWITALTVLTILIGIAGCNRDDTPVDPEPMDAEVQLEEQGFACYRYSIITPDVMDLISFRRQDLVISGYIRDHTLESAVFFDYTHSDQPYYMYGPLQTNDPALQARWEAFLQENGLQATDILTLLQERAEASYSPAQISNLLMDEQARLDVNGDRLTIKTDGAIFEAQYENDTLKQATYRQQSDADRFIIYPTPSASSSVADAYSDFLYSLGIIHSEWIDYLIDSASLIEEP